MSGSLARRLGRLGLVTRFTIVGATVAILVASGVAWLVEGRVAELLLAQVAARATEQVELGVLHQVTAADFTPPHTSTRLDAVATRLDPALARLRQDGAGVIRLHVFARDGTVVYSDLPSKRGQVVVPAAGSALAMALQGATVSKLSALSSPENAELQARYGGALEVYVPLLLGGADRGCLRDLC